MSAIPNMAVLTPCDAPETYQAVRAAAAYPGPVYIRVNRNDMKPFTGRDDPFEIGKMRVLRQGADAAIFAHGTMVEAAMAAAGLLEQEGISVRVVNVATMKPFDEAFVRRTAGEVKAIVTAEEHTYIGGLASRVALALRKSATPMDYVAVDDRFGQSARGAAELMAHYGLTAENIAGKVRACIQL
jgi:transketolase